MRDYRNGKAMAAALRSGLKEKGVVLSVAESLELVARQLGLESWNVLAAKIDAAEQAALRGAWVSQAEALASGTPRGNEMPRAFLPCRDFDLSKRFYAALGFRQTLDTTTIAIFAMGASGVLLTPHSAGEQADNRSMQLAVDDLDAWWTHILHLDLPGRFGVRPPRPPVMEPWGQRISYVYDPSGVLWYVAQR